MASVKTSISLSPDVAQALDAAARKLGIDRSRYIERAVLAQLDRSRGGEPPTIPPDRLLKLRDIGALAKARVDRLIGEGRVRFG